MPMARCWLFTRHATSAGIKSTRGYDAPPSTNARNVEAAVERSTARQAAFQVRYHGLSNDEQNTGPRPPVAICRTYANGAASNWHAHRHRCGRQSGLTVEDGEFVDGPWIHRGKRGADGRLRP